MPSTISNKQDVKIMQTCTKCGAAYEGYACPTCGITSTQGYQEPTTYGQEQQKLCLGCGQQILASYNNCPHCGKSAAEVQQQTYTPPPPPPAPAAQPAYTPPPPPGAAPVYAPIPPPAQKKAGPSKAMIVLLVIIAVVIASIAMAVMFTVVTNPFNDAVEVFSGDIISGSMPGSGTDDLYKINLSPGEVLYVTLNGAGGTDFDLYVYENVLFWDEYIITGSATDTSTEEVAFVAWETGYYILNVYSYEGSGDYNLDIEIIETISLDDGDNTISSAFPLDRGDTISDGLNEYYDRDDYYSVYVNQGEILYAFLEVPVQTATDFDLYIYDESGNTMGVSEAAYGNEELSIYATNTGNYYVNAWAYDGIGIYSLYVETFIGPSSDSNNALNSAQEIYNGAYFSETLNGYEGVDTDDYYAIYLGAGDTITASMTGPGDADFDLYLYDEDGNIVAYSEEYTSSETIVYSAPYEGYYYVNPYAFEGSGPYTLSVNIGGGGSSVYANAGYDRSVGTGQSITFDGTGSSGQITSYDWDFGDGSSGTGSAPSHTYSAAGTYMVTLVVSDTINTDSDTITVTVQDSGTMQNKYAVVIGISDYQGDGDLNFCDEDAEAWEAYLISQGYTVHTLIDTQATAANIYDEIAWLEAQEEAGDYVAFCFSGHGFYSDRERESGLCAWNVEEQEGWLYDSAIGDAFANFDSDHIFFFFDSCHSGGMDSVAGSGRYVSQTAGQMEYGLDAAKHERGMWVYWFLEHSIKDLGYTDLVQAHDVAAPLATNDAATVQNPMHPEEEYSGTSFYL